MLANGVVVGRIFKANAAPVGQSWMWTLIFPHHEGRSPTHGYEATRETAMAAFAKSGGANEAHEKAPPVLGPAGLSNKGWRDMQNLSTGSHFTGADVRIRTAMRSD